MKIVFYTDSNITRQVVQALQQVPSWIIDNKSHDIHIENLKTSEFASLNSNIQKNMLIYLDVEHMEADTILTDLYELSEKEYIRFGIIDVHGKISDPAAIFHNGGVDYITEYEVLETLPEGRLETIVSFSPFTYKTIPHTQNAGDIIPSGDGWEYIQEGDEYTFCFMFIELDNTDFWKNKGEDQLNKLKQTFHDEIEGQVKKIDGHIWMWSSFGGIVLFPFNGTDCPAILHSFKLILNMTLLSFERFDMSRALSYRIVLHLGNTIYRERGNTGEIVSDTINSICHIGYKNSKEKSLVITEELFPYIPEPLKSYFVSLPPFEGRKLCCMKDFK